MKILFLRHGIAEDRDLEKADELRELTPEGIRELEENARFLKMYLTNDLVRLITSPLQRAVDTARILTEAGFKEGQTMNFVATGNFGVLKRLVKADPETTLLIVGHSPYLEEWIFAITKQSIQMEKAACAQVEITDEAEFAGFVTWYLPITKYKRLIRLGSYKAMTDQLGGDIAAIIEKYHLVILENREVYLKEPAEIESVHKLRVKIRQFRSLVSFFKPLLSKSKYQTIQQILREMAQQCAYLRELDVLIKEWGSRRAEFKQAGLSGDTFFQILKTERQTEQDRLFAKLEKPEFAKDLNAAIDLLYQGIDLNKAKHLKLSEMVETTLNKWHDEIKAEYSAICVNDLSIIHALRIKAKKMRYIMEVFELDLAQGSKEMYKEIKRWQEVLGNITDANRNSEAVMEIAEKFPDTLIQEELKVFKAVEKKEADLLYQEFFGLGKQEATDGLPTSVLTEDTNAQES